jgi:hypothetical protein
MQTSQQGDAAGDPAEQPARFASAQANLAELKPAVKRGALLDADVDEIDRKIRDARLARLRATAALE